MPKGPKLNNIHKNFTTRDCLGIEGVAATIQGEVCPIVNTVTPRAFYWPFMVWIYYDFYKYSGIEERSYKAFDCYLKRQDYFFVLATLLTPGADQSGLVGKQQSDRDIDNNPNGPYDFNQSYFKSRFGGMMYYNAGCLSMYLVVDHEYEKDIDLKFPVLTKEGEQMALAFEAVIKDTEYYKNYRRNNIAVPRKVLEEYGKVINFGLIGFDECKKLLRYYMFEDTRASQLIDRSKLLKECGEYIKYIIHKYHVTDLDKAVCRQVFYDHQLPSGDIITIPATIVTVANKWEIVIGRQYFTSGLEMIWKYMLEQLTSPLTMQEWFDRIFTTADFKWDIEKKLIDIIDECNYSFIQREKMIDDAIKGMNDSLSVENGLRIIFSVYNRFKNRKDFGEEEAYFTYGIESRSIAFVEFFEIIEEYKNRSIKELTLFIMKQWLVKQHYITAFEKMLQNRDGFYYEIIDGLYIKKHDFDLKFQDIRMTSLKQVMTDLDML